LTGQTVGETELHQFHLRPPGIKTEIAVYVWHLEINKGEMKMLLAPAPKSLKLDILQMGQHQQQKARPGCRGSHLPPLDPSLFKRKAKSTKPVSSREKETKRCVNRPIEMESGSDLQKMTAKVPTIPK